MSLQQISTLCLGVALSTIALGGARASLLVYDSFDYESGTFISSQTGGQGFVTEWIDDAGVPEDADFVRAGGLSYGGLATSGNSLQNVAAGAVGGTVIRGTENAAGSAGSTTWVSFLFALEGNSGSVGEFDMFSLALSRSDSFGLSSTFQMGVFASEGSLYFGLGDAVSPVQLSSTSLVLGETYFLTASIEWDANGSNEVIRLYLNPSPNGGTPDPSSAIAVLDTQNLAFGSVNTLGAIGVYAYDFETEWAFDELRIGTTFGDVAPTTAPEPSAAMLMLGAMGMLQLMRRKRDCAASHQARAA